MQLSHLRSVAVLAASALTLVPSLAAAAGDSGDALANAIHRANTEWADAMKRGDAARIAAPYAANATFVLADGTCVRGKAAIETLYRDGFAKTGPADATKIASKQLVRDGDLAYESGYAEVAVTRQGKHLVNIGRYLTVWEEQSDGEWKILRNVVLP